MSLTSAVFGTTSARKVISIRPAGVPPIVMSKYTMGLFSGLPGGMLTSGELDPQPMIKDYLVQVRLRRSTRSLFLFDDGDDLSVQVKVLYEL